MAFSDFQRVLCRLFAGSRVQSAGLESYVASGAAQKGSRSAPCLSRDVGLFHDTLEALDATWKADAVLLKVHGYDVEVMRERSGFVEALISRGGERVEVQWVRDSAFRFFPLLTHPDLGLTLHPFDLATNKVLALVGRVEVRDWIETLTCHEKVAPLGLLAWAACGKDEGWNPQLILDEAARTARYSREEIQELAWSGAAPDFAALKTVWRAALADARQLTELLPLEEIGNAVLDARNVPFRGTTEQLREQLQNGATRFHAGHIGGALPRLKLDGSQ